MSEWRTVAVGDMGVVVTGATPKASEQDSWGDHLDFITPSDQEFGRREATPSRRLSSLGASRLHKKIVPAGSTCFTCIGSTIGKVSLTVRDAVTNQQMNTIVPNGEYDGRFVYYQLLHRASEIAQIASGSATSIINKSHFSSYRVSVPGLEVQQAIGAVLGALDDKIAVNERVATTADTMCDLMFRRSAQRYAGVPMSRLLRPVLGGTPDRKNESYWGGSVPWASAKDVVNATVGVLTSTEEHITETAAQNSRAKTLRPGSVVLTARGTVGAVARMAMPAAINQSCYAFEPGRVPAAVLFHLVRSAAKSMLGVAHGTVFSTVNMQTFDHVEIPDLPADVLDGLNGELAPLHRLIVRHLQESRHLATLRDTLLPSLMSGRLRVKDAEKIVEDAT